MFSLFTNIIKCKHLGIYHDKNQCEEWIVSCVLFSQRKGCATFFVQFLCRIVISPRLFRNRRSYRYWRAKYQHEILMVHPRTGWIFSFVVNFEQARQTDYRKDWQKEQLCRSYNWYKFLFLGKSDFTWIKIKISSPSRNFLNISVPVFVNTPYHDCYCHV